MQEISTLALPLTVGLFVFLTVLVIAWILLPFAMFGMKSLLRQMIHETRRTNALLESLSAGRQDASSSTTGPLPTRR